MSNKLDDTTKIIYSTTKKRAWETLWKECFFELPKRSPLVADIHKDDIDTSKPHAIWRYQAVSNKHKYPFYALTIVCFGNVQTYRIFAMNE